MMLVRALGAALLCITSSALSPRNDVPIAAVPGEAAPLAAAHDASGVVPTMRAKAFNLSDVRLIADADNHFQQAQELNTEFLKYLEADRLLYTFRTIAQLPQAPGAEPYGGWISPVGRDELVNGHFTGHFLSALAFTAAATDDPAIVEKSKYMVQELGKCQDAICKNNATRCGYLSAYYFSQLEAMENHEGGTWATLYTLHKIMAGLFDTYENTANDQALSILVKMADFLKKRIDAVIASKGWGWWELCLEVEFGGMNEVAYNLYAITGKEDHKVLGDYFYKARFMDLLANSTEFALTGQHANTHLPEVIGVARGWELTGNSTLSDITNFFYRILMDHYTYAATGGSNEGEHWLFPDRLGTAIATVPGQDSAGYHTEESCTQYNVLKVVRHLFKWSPSAALGDDYEHKVNNGVIGIQHPGEVGTMVYMTPLGNGVARPKANWGEGWGSANASFWCCYGTAVESFGKLGDSLYFHDDTAGEEQQLWIVQYVSSVVRWRSAGVNVTQAVSYSFAPDSVSLVSKITVGELPGGSSSASSVAAVAGAAGATANDAATTTINLRIPGWAAVATSTVELNGQPLVKAGTAKNGTFLQIKSAFKPGDVITASYGMAPWFAKLNDNRTAYDTVGTLHYGPYALVALTDGDYALKADLQDIDSWLKLTPGGTDDKRTMQFTATGSDGKAMTLLPLNRVVDQNYTAHLNISTDATQCLCGEADKCAAAGAGTAAGTPSISLDLNTLLATGSASVNGGFIRSGNPKDVSNVLMNAPFQEDPGAGAGAGAEGKKSVSSIITGVELSFSYTIGYDEAPGTTGASMAVAFYEGLEGNCPNLPPATGGAGPNATVLWTSPQYLKPEYDKTHNYSAPVNVSLSGLHLGVGKGSRLGLRFEDNDRNMQVLLPIEVKLTWAQE